MREGFRRDQTAAAKADAQRAAAMLKQSEIVAKEKEIRAPADGIIIHRLAEPGQLIAAGQPAVTMAFADRLFVRTFIPEGALGKVKMGTAARLSVDAFPNRTFAARITEISPESEFTPKAVETSLRRSEEAMITATGLTRAFGRNVALDSVDLHIGRGELFGLIGPDGAGKSTFFRILARLLSPTSGSIAIEAGTTFGLVPQRFAMYEDLSVDENLQLRAIIALAVARFKKTAA